VELVWNVATSAVLSETQRALLHERLASKLTDNGELRIVSSETRSQLQNRELAEVRLATIVRGALVVPKVRKATKPSRAVKQARLDNKRRTTEKKRERRWRGED